MRTVDVEIRGAEGLRLVGIAVRRLGSDRTIVNEMAKEIRGAVPPIRAAVKASALANLPKRGGLNRWTASAKLTAQVRRGAQSAGVSLRDSKGSRGKRHDLRALNDGFIRHPLWGNREHWYPQRVAPEFFQKAIVPEGVDAFRNKVVVAVDRAVEKVL